MHLTESKEEGEDARSRLIRLGEVASRRRLRLRGPRHRNGAAPAAANLGWSAHLETLLLREESETQQEGAIPPSAVAGWSDHLSAILCGTRDLNSPLSILGGMEDTLVRSIYTDVATGWKNCVTRTMPAHKVGRMRAELVAAELPDEYETHNSDYTLSTSGRGGQLRAASIFMASPFNYALVGCTIEDRPRIAFSSCGSVSFPEPKDRNVNMMPFVLGNKESLPEYLHPYYDSCIARCPAMPDEIGKVCYLTVAEGYVSASDTQRRGGLHVEAPGSHAKDSNFVAAIEHAWGCGVAFFPDELHGGLFMASNMHHTCAVWNALVDTQTGAVDSHGGMNHLRPFLGPATKLSANELVWLTDKTPHEALPQEQDGYRQFFRVVTSSISLWFEDHSTPNPKCPLPDHVQIMKGSKFQLRELSASAHS